jgi:flagellar biosynthesis protein FliP
MYGITKFAMANLGLLKIAMTCKELTPQTISLPFKIQIGMFVEWFLEIGIYSF